MEDSSPIVGNAHDASAIDAFQGGALPMELRPPSVPCRPGGSPEFDASAFTWQDLDRPDPLAPAESFREHASGLLRVLDDDGLARGAWQPNLTPAELRNGLEMMLRTRNYDSRLISMQRQGRLSFSLTTRGEEAVSVAAALAYRHDDMLFPTYRQSGLMLVRGMPMVAMMCQCIGNTSDNAKGRQMPVHYSWKAGNVMSISSPVGTQLSQSVGAAMAFAYRGERNVVGAWVGDGTTAQGDFYYALNFAGTYRPPCVLHVVDNQWAISSHRTLAAGGRSFAARAEAYGLPGLRIDGNDYLAVHAAEAWAIERARRGGGPTFIDAVTYRYGAHSTSDDPTQYRAAEDVHWPGGDPIDRLKHHLIQLGQWSEESHQDLNEALEYEATKAFENAESFGKTHEVGDQPLSNMFEDVYESMPEHLQAQLTELEGNAAEDDGPDTMPMHQDQERRAS